MQCPPAVNGEAPFTEYTEHVEVRPAGTHEQCLFPELVSRSTCALHDKCVINMTAGWTEVSSAHEQVRNSGSCSGQGAGQWYT